MHTIKSLPRLENKDYLVYIRGLHREALYMAKKKSSPSKTNSKKKVTKKKSPTLAQKADAKKKSTQKVAVSTQKKSSAKKAVVKMAESKAKPKTKISEAKEKSQLIQKKLADKSLKSQAEAQAPVAVKKVKAPKLTASERAAKEALKKATQKWQALLRRNKNKKAPKYKMTEAFEEKTPIQHKLLGWGYILSNKNDRLEVLFESGVKQLISNYKK